MFHRSLLFAVILVVSSPTFAQTQPSATQQGAPTGTPAGQAGTTGMQTITTSTMPVTYVNRRPTDVAASMLMGVSVYSKQDESIGEIEDLLVENGKTVRAVILSVGGFLGIGERYVSVDPSSLTFLRSGNTGAVRAILDTTKDQLKQAPTFEYSKRSR